jgi:hypothetical protein
MSNDDSKAREIFVPFRGFFDWFAREVADCTESARAYLGSAVSDEDKEAFLEYADYRELERAYARAYVDAVNSRLGLSIRFKLVESPKAYNFVTDRILGEITAEDAQRMANRTSKSALDRVVKARCTSRDGFISYYANDYREWGGIADWDYNQLGILLEAFLIQECGDDWEDEVSEPCASVIDPLVEEDFEAFLRARAAEGV